MNIRQRYAFLALFCLLVVVDGDVGAVAMQATLQGVSDELTQQREAAATPGDTNTTSNTPNNPSAGSPAANNSPIVTPPPTVTTPPPTVVSGGTTTGSGFGVASSTAGGSFGGSSESSSTNFGGSPSVTPISTPAPTPSPTPSVSQSTSTPPVLSTSSYTSAPIAAKSPDVRPASESTQHVETSHQKSDHPKMLAEPAVPKLPAVPVEKPTVSPQELLEQQKQLQQIKQEQDKKNKELVPDEGIDTLDEDGGNWLLKRKALEDTVDKIEQINDLFTKILESRMDFLVKRNKVDHDYDLFANELGFDLGDLDQLLTAILEEWQAEEKKDGDLNATERSFVQEVEQKKANVEQLQANLKEIMELDASIDDVIIQLEEEINLSHSYQAQAWDNFQLIKKTLSDEKAHKLYLQTDGLLNNLQDIYQNYLQGALLTFFNNTVQTLNDEMTKARQAYQNLSTAGIDLKKKAEQLLVVDEQEDEQRLVQEREAELKKALADLKAKESSSWWNTFALLWRYPIQKVGDLFEYIFSFFASPTEVAMIAKPSGPVGQQETPKIDEKAETE